MKNLILIAPPAAGKGTQSEILVKEYNYRHISTGDLFRKEIATGSEFGKRIAEIIASGKLVDNETTNKILKQEFITLKNDEKFVLDGYPRNISQAKDLEVILKEINKNDYVTIYMDVDKEVAMKRSTGRMLCRDCNSIFHKYNESMIPKTEGLCDHCGGELYQRDDDNEKSFNVRFDTYLDNISSVLEFYKNNNRLKSIKVMDKKEDTFKNIADILE